MLVDSDHMPKILFRMYKAVNNCVHMEIERYCICASLDATGGTTV